MAFLFSNLLDAYNFYIRYQYYKHYQHISYAL